MNSRLEGDNEYIKRIIETDTPFFIGRIAGCELNVACNFINKITIEEKEELARLENNAGIKITSQHSLEVYVKKLIKSYHNCTGIAIWDTSGSVFAHIGYGQQLITSKTLNIPKINALSLEPYYFDRHNSWMGALKGKKILIIHPFVKTFKRQQENLKNIFPDRSWFEDCELQFIQPPLTLAGNHQNKDWQEHYIEFTENLKKQIKPDFDIALVAAGGYGMLIADYIFTELKKSVMYIGGALQLFFGVIGKRWFDNKEIMKMVNDNWIRPDKDDKPQNFTNVERGCYW